MCAPAVHSGISAAQTIRVAASSGTLSRRRIFAATSMASAAEWWTGSTGIASIVAISAAVMSRRMPFASVSLEYPAAFSVTLSEKINAQERVLLSKARRYYADALAESQASGTFGQQERVRSMEQLQAQMASGELTEEQARSPYPAARQPRRWRAQTGWQRPGGSRRGRSRRRSCRRRSWLCP